jgi:hypothetical protein
VGAARHGTIAPLVAEADGILGADEVLEGAHIPL